MKLSQAHHKHTVLKPKFTAPVVFRKMDTRKIREQMFDLDPAEE